MAKTRMMSTDYWSDTRVDMLDPIEKLLYIYCFTNDKSCWSGCTEIPIKKIWYETWIDRDMVTKILKRFEDDGKVAYINWYLVVRNFIKYHFSGINSPEKRSKNNQLKSIVQWIKKLPKEVLEFAISFIPEYSVLLANHEELKPLASPLQAPPKGIVPFPFPLPSSSPLSSNSGWEKKNQWNRKKKAGQIITYSDQFLDFREMSPKTWDKSKAFESYELVIDAWIDAELLKAKITEYKEQQIFKNWDAKKYTKHVSTWLNNQGRENEYDTWPEYFTDEHFQRYVKNCVWKDTYYCPFDKKEYPCIISSYSYAWWVAKRTWEDINELEKKAEKPYDNFTNPSRLWN